MKLWIARMLTLALCLPLLASAAPTLRAWLDRDTARLGESVTLNVEAEGRVAGEPDFSALDGDFRRLGTQSSQQMSIVNGAASVRVGGNEIATLGPGDIIGEGAIVNHKLRNASVVMTERTEVLHFTREQVEQLCEEIPAFKEALDKVAEERLGG